MNFDLQTECLHVMLNEMFSNVNYSFQYINEWYKHCKNYIIASWFDDLDIPCKLSTDTEFNKIIDVVDNHLRNQSFHMFKQMYNDEFMLGLLNDYHYTEKDENIRESLKFELRKTCEWLIHLCITCSKYHVLRLLDEDVQDAIAEYGKRYSDKILQSAKFKLDQIDNLNMSFYSKILVGYDKQILKFIDDYTHGKFKTVGSLKDMLIAINEFKDVAHFHGTLLSGDDPFYIFGNDHTELYNSITQLNRPKLEKELEKMLGY